MDRGPDRDSSARRYIGSRARASRRASWLAERRRDGTKETNPGRLQLRQYGCVMSRSSVGPATTRRPTQRKVAGACGCCST